MALWKILSCINQFEQNAFLTKEMFGSQKAFCMNDYNFLKFKTCFFLYQEKKPIIKN